MPEINSSSRNYPKIALHKCHQYDRVTIAKCLEQSKPFTALSESFHGKTVLLKPNLISGKGPEIACTNREFIAGVAQWFLDHGAKVLLGDSPAFGSAQRVCQKLGITHAVQGMDVQIVDFVTPVRMRLDSGITVTLAREALECDTLVGMPKIKAHNQMYMTMAVKNIFGVIKGVNKAKLHMTHGESHERFAEIILDLLPLFPSQVHVADGIEVMHKSGPLDGDPLPLASLAIADCPVALDTAMLLLLKLDPAKSPLWRSAASRGHLGSKKNKLSYPLFSPEDFIESGFVAPDHLNGIRFNPLRFAQGLMKRVLLKVSG